MKTICLKCKEEFEVNHLKEEKEFRTWCDSCINEIYDKIQIEMKGGSEKENGKRR